MAGRYGRKYAKEEDFEEGEVWGVMEGKKVEMINSTPKPRKPINKDSSFFTAPRMIPRSSSSEVFTGGKKQSSAPLNIPDWSKIYGKTSNKNNQNNTNIKNNFNTNSYNNNYYINGCNNNGEDDYDEEEEEEEGIVPPHEYLARKLARNQICSFSVYEGIGRTLKGRDLSKVRNAILSKTGFLE